jgi:[protein-PII] uridylyltransferase
VLADEVNRLLDGELDAGEVESHFQFLPSRYFELHEAPAIERDLRLVHRFIHRQLDLVEDPLEPELAWRSEQNRGCATLRVCTWDRPGLFGKITGALTAAGLNILEAQIFTRLDSIVIDTFAVVQAPTGLLPTGEDRETCKQLFVRALGSKADAEDLADRIAQRPQPPALYYSVEGARVPTTVRFDHETSDYYTIIDLEAEDHVGLLYAVTRELAELQLDISLARINTERGAAIDTFYVTEVGGSKVVDPEREREIGRRLQQAIAALE